MRFISTLFALIILTSGCSNEAPDSGLDSFVDNPRYGAWQEAEEPPLRFVLEQTWGIEDGEPEDMIARIGPFQVDVSGNVYLLNGREGTLRSWDAEGDHRWTASGKGEGPGEFQQAYSMIYDGDSSLYVFNQSGSRIDRFSTSGEFQESITTESLGLSRLAGIGMLGPDMMAASETLWGKIGVGVRVLSRETGAWALADSFDIDQTGDTEWPRGVSSGPTVLVFKDGLANGSNSEYRIELRDTGGEVKQTITRNVDGMVRSGVHEDGNTVMISTFSGLQTPVPVGNGYHLVESWWPTEEIDPDEQVRAMMEARQSGASVSNAVENQSTLDLYDADFKLLYSLESPGRGHEAFGRVLTADDEGRIYAITNADFPQIGRYRVEITQPE
jgi:hypothetical protein